MTFDLSTIPAATREEQIRIGRQYSSRDTLDQANQTLGALDTYDKALAAEGFIPADGTRLAAARDLLAEAGVDREAVRGSKKATSRAYGDAMKEGKAKRLRARTILENTRAALLEGGAPGAPEAAREVDATLRQTQTAGDDAEALARQLDQLAQTLSASGVRAEAKSRGGAQALADLGASASALRAAAQQGATVQGTPAETQRLDHLDGIIVGLVRRARKAARSAAQQLGDPAIATAFELTKLYRSTGRARKKAGAPKGE
jgi:hypothetical protein